jgi:hypothetical protein
MNDTITFKYEIERTQKEHGYNDLFEIEANATIDTSGGDVVAEFLHCTPKTTLTPLEIGLIEEEAAALWEELQKDNNNSINGIE